MDTTGKAISSKSGTKGKWDAGRIRDLSGRVFAAISVSGPAWKMPLSEVSRVAKIVIHHADAISRALGYQP